MVHIYDGLFLSHKKEQIWGSSSVVDEPRACYTQWSKSGREKQILNINGYICNIERCTDETLQGSSRDTGIENRLVDTVGEVQGGMNWESSIET